jgi:hypothetical protein
VTIYDGPADLASLSHDVLFERLPSGRSGPTSLSAPGTPTWTAPFKATGLSADGRLVVGDVRGPSDRIQVRQVGSGKVVADLAVPGHANWQPLAIQGNHQVLVQATVHGKGRSLFRCDFQGTCLRTWSWLSDSIFAGSHFSGPAFGIDFD